MINPKFTVNELVDVTPTPGWSQLGIVTEVRETGYMVRIEGNYITKFFKESEIEKATEGAKLNHEYYKNYYSHGCDCGAEKAHYPNSPPGHAFYCTKVTQHRPWSSDDDGHYGF